MFILLRFFCRRIQLFRQYLHRLFVVTRFNMSCHLHQNGCIEIPHRTAHLRNRFILLIYFDYRLYSCITILCCLL